MKLLALFKSSFLAVIFLTSMMAQANAVNPTPSVDAGLFDMADVTPQGVLIAEGHTDHKCGTGCGSKDKDKGGDHKCGTGCGSKHK